MGRGNMTSFLDPVATFTVTVHVEPTNGILRQLSVLLALGRDVPDLVPTTLRDRHYTSITSQTHWLILSTPLFIYLYRPARYTDFIHSLGPRTRPAGSRPFPVDPSGPS